MNCISKVGMMGTALILMLFFILSSPSFAGTVTAQWNVPVDNPDTPFVQGITAQYFIGSDAPITDEQVMAALESGDWEGNGLSMLSQELPLAPGQVANYAFVIEDVNIIKEYAVVAVDENGNFSVSNRKRADFLAPAKMTNLELVY